MAPTQKSRLAVTKPSEMEACPPLVTRCSVRFCTQSPKERIRLSRSSSSPIRAPSTMDKMAMRELLPSRQPLMPRYITHRATPCMMMVLSRSASNVLPAGSRVEKWPASQVSSIPSREPTRMAAAFTRVPVSMKNPPFQSGPGPRHCPEAGRPWQEPRGCWLERCAVPAVGSQAERPRWVPQD